jgi:uncharacterized protein
MGDQPDLSNHRSIVVTGLRSSGRTTFVYALSEIPYLLPQPGAMTVAMDFGKINVEDGCFYVFGAPDGRRFDFMYEIMSPRLLGWIVLIDSTRSDTFREAHTIITLLDRAFPLPVVVATNFQDKPDAWDSEAIQIILNIAPHIPVVPCIATDRASVANVLLALCDKVLESAEEATGG